MRKKCWKYVYMYKLGNCCFCIFSSGMVHNMWTFKQHMYMYVRIYKIMSDTIRHEIKIRLSSLSFSKPKTWYWIIAIVTNWYDIKVCCACASASGRKDNGKTFKREQLKTERRNIKFKAHPPSSVIQSSIHPLYEVNLLINYASILLWDCVCAYVCIYE